MVLMIRRNLDGYEIEYPDHKREKINTDIYLYRKYIDNKERSYLVGDIIPIGFTFAFDLIGLRDDYKLVRHRKMKAYGVPYLLAGEGWNKGVSWLYLPLSMLSMRFEDSTQPMLSDDYMACYRTFFIKGTMMPSYSSRTSDSLVHNGRIVYENGELIARTLFDSYPTEQHIKRQKLIKDIEKTCGVDLSRIDWELRKVLEHYRIVKKRKIK